MLVVVVLLAAPAGGLLSYAIPRTSNVQDIESQAKSQSLRNEREIVSEDWRV